MSVWLFAAVGVQAQELRQITVTGEGVAAAVPDMATISLGVSHRADSAEAAMDQVSQSVAAILDLLPRFGIDARDMQTSGLSLYPVFASASVSGADRITGFEASNGVTLRVRDLDQLGAALEAVLKTGANRLSGLSFGVQEPAPLQEAARRDAVADAMARAQVYAEAAGVTLGPVVSISENGGGYRPEPMMMAARADSVPVAAGEATISASVTMVFALAD
ncbi:SIMPL domain-containing protein [Mesobacterium sp. TK19101]|uniref:SIMPL domain-containing protein n=1 Tax=Mesobacterium hydrothermale TaxID=3111907 RepID=A0ABU6HFS5_9RHOB|nr:SIMPL domain-containing protein [Mesobacterium sp. TK19101]MEC3859955.1 SIMPL domain-containing protein [Mesobacterium sp. TK19101]